MVLWIVSICSQGKRYRLIELLEKKQIRTTWDFLQAEATLPVIPQARRLKALLCGAGGIGTEAVLNSAEKYNPETKSWEPLSSMHQKRKLCSGCFMDNKFYVIGGRDENDKALSCGEAYDKDKNTWELIPDMLKGNTVATSQSPPLVAVVNNDLYCLETSSNELRVYLKKSNEWKKLGLVPVRADLSRGWGVAFKSLGNELLVIGFSSSILNGGMTIYTCSPQPDTEELQWRCIEGCKDRLNFFLLNCSIMVA
ncbi:Kelch repeat type 1 [Corchorus capsularis]|uniref:Kelch repeat type 1 n=1 Tax=Corchorus capsularis TaxID=210143 RepID=A0A1R3IRX9_COCAP|nr:Kelch repeat type 1 [Corchorus capsularis]